MSGCLDLAWNRSAVMYSMVKKGRGWKLSHLGPIRQGARQRNKEVHALEPPTRPIRGTSVAPALLPRASRIPDFIYG